MQHNYHFIKSYCRYSHLIFNIVIVKIDHDMADLYEYSTPEIVRLMGERFKDYRMRCNMTQKDVSDLTGLGNTTISKFENGTATNLSLSTFILLLKVVGCIDALDNVLPELPKSPYLVRDDDKKVKRIRHKQNS